MPLMILAMRGLICSAGAQADGTKQWGPFSVGGFIASAPAINADGSTIYVSLERPGGGGRVLAISPDGKLIRWQRDISARIDATPAVAADGMVYVGAGNGHFYGFDPNNAGAIKLDLALAPSTFIDSSAAIAGDRTIYFGSGDSIALTGALHAVSPDTNKEIWSFPPAGAPAIGFVESSPAIAPDGTIYFGSQDKNLYAVTPAGTEKWHFQTGGRILSSPAIGADGTIYFGSADQKLYAVTPQGTKKWEFGTRDDIQSSPVLGADGTVYFGGMDTTFYALNPEDGIERWTTSVLATMAAAAAVRGDGAIIVPADDNTVRAFDPNGQPLWARVLGDADLIDGLLVAPDGSIYVGSEDGNLYKLNGSGSPMSVLSSWPGFHRDVARTGRAAPAHTGGVLANIATRARVTGTGTLIAGFVVQGASEKAYLIRAVGPGLAQTGVGGFLPDPQLELFVGSTSLQKNDNWPERDPISGFSLSDTANGVGAFVLPPASRDAAMVRLPPPGAYTAVVTSVDGRAGVALVEIYDARGGDLTSRVINLSTRGPVGTGEDILIAGFVVGGTSPMRLLLRGIGPGLAQFKVGGVLARPRIELFSGTRSLRANSGWTTDGFRNDLMVAASSVSAFTLDPQSADTAMIFDAAPGPYTLQISGIGQTTGEAMVEIYVLP